MAEKIKVLLFKVGELPKLVEIDNTLKAMQSLVDGWLESVRCPWLHNVFLICNEEGRLKNLPHNRCVGFLADPVVGDFFFTRATPQGDETSLTKSDALVICGYLGTVLDES